MRNLNDEYPLMNCIRAFFQCSSQLYFSLADVSTVAAKRKCKGCWNIRVEHKDRTQRDEQKWMELFSKYRVGSLLKCYSTHLIFLCTQLDLTPKSNLTVTAMYHFG